MKFLEFIKLRHRAKKYQRKEDPGGIAYINSVIKKGDTVFDIGAHKGGYLFFIFQQVGASGRVIALEPQTMLFNYLQKIRNLFGWNNVIVEHLALSDKQSTATLYIPDNKKSRNSSPGASLLKQEGRDDFNASEEVKTDSLDGYCQKHQLRPSFLKVDVEGNELKIFKGGVETLKKYKPKILVEIEARHVGKEQVMETIRFMEGLGYKSYFLKGLDHVPAAEFSFDKHQNTGDMANYCNNFIFE